MATTESVKCLVCDKTFVARSADRKRGWAQCCSKSCAAVKRQGHVRKYGPDLNRAIRIGLLTTDWLDSREDDDNDGYEN